MIRVSKSRLAGKPGYVALWRDKAGKKFCRGLNTTNEIEADLAIADLQRILNTPALHEPLAVEHVASDPRAYRAFFQKPKPELKSILTETVPESFFTGRMPNISLVKTDKPPFLEVVDNERKIEIQIISEEHSRAVEAAATNEKRANLAERKLETVLTENLRLSKALNRHCRKKLATAIEEFSIGKTDVSKESQDRYREVLKDFRIFLGCMMRRKDYREIGRATDSAEAIEMAEVGGEFLIADIRGRHIDDFLAARPDKKTGQPITEVRKAALRRELSVPYHFWVRRYELTFDAFDHAQPLTGHKSVSPDSREMIRTVQDLKRLMWAIEQEDENALYWNAFVGTAALTGADLSALFDLTPQDLILEKPERLIMCRGKTGRQRDTPVERTLLLPILRKYRKSLSRDQRYLFPSVLPAGTRPRTHTEAGRWSGASAFGDAWKKIGQRCRERIKGKYKLGDAETSHCLLGPRAWRRTAVTLMNGAGCLPGQVARWVGHSVAIADKHYLGRVEKNSLQFEKSD